MDSKNRKLPIYVAIGIVVLVSVWMLSGMGNEPAAEQDLLSTTRGSALPQVRIQPMQAREITRQIMVSGRTAANRTVELKAEAEGVVSAIHVERGAAIGQGDKLLSLDLRDREARLQEARALVKQRELEFKAQNNLRGQQFSSETQIAQAEAALESARAAQRRIELEIAYTGVTAPFAGVIQEREVEIGDFIRVGDSVAQLVDLDPIIVVGEVNEREISHIELGSEGSAVLTDGRRLEGTIRYLSRVADPATRTFRVELAIPNMDNSVRAGLTAQLSLSADSVRVHTISSALLSLADDGTIGVKVVDTGERVRFYPVEIVGSTQDGLHVSGLPDSVRMITVGQGFVTEGQQVRAQDGGPETNIIESGV